MSPKITVDILYALLDCRLKAYLKLAGQRGVTSDYQSMLDRARQHVRRTAIADICSSYDGSITIGARLNRAMLARGSAFVLDAQLDDDGFLVDFDALKKVDGPSSLGNFHYIPVLFAESERIHKSQCRILEALGFLLSRVQGRTPERGVVYHGRNCKMTTVRLATGLKSTEGLIEDGIRMRGAQIVPPLLINDHCTVCEFRQQCHAQAVKEENLSLMRGLRENAIKRYRRKGLVTLTQLAHTFRPRRKGKRSDRPSKVRNYALQALAIRDKTVYVLGAPKLPSRDVQIYLDLEGDPDEQYIYLIGMIVRDGDREECFSFWADTKDHEHLIFERFLAVVSRYQAPIVFCYGSYERTFLNRLRKRARRKKPVDKVLGALVNTLSIIYDHFYFPTYSNRLKEIAGCLGYLWSDQNASGLQSMVWRSHWERTREEQWKEKLVAYNLEDCHALRKVTDFLCAASVDVSTLQRPLSSGKLEPRVSNVQELDRLADVRRWGSIKFFHAEFEFVNRRAYFDYQRERVFVRTSKSRKARLHKSRVHLNRRLKPTVEVVFTATNCPACGGTELNHKRVNASQARIRGSNGRLTLLSLPAASSDASSNVGPWDIDVRAAAISLLRIDIAD